MPEDRADIATLKQLAQVFVQYRARKHDPQSYLLAVMQTPPVTAHLHKVLLQNGLEVFQVV